MKPGDTVCILNELGEGKIIRVINKEKVIVDFGDGMEITMQTHDLVLVKRANPDELDHEDELPMPEIKTEPEDKLDLTRLKNHDFSPRRQEKQSKIDLQAFANSLTPLEVDLHIQKLTADFIGLSNSEIMSIQLSHFESYMDQGMSGHYRSIIFIHGIGGGVLKNEILRRLKGYKMIRFNEGDPRKYGFGATQVHFEF